MPSESFHIPFEETYVRNLPEDGLHPDISDCYLIGVLCSNCGLNERVYIRKGIPLSRCKCPKCECIRTLSR